MDKTIMNKAVILARGLGTRMRKQDDGAGLTEDQAHMADTGVKAMIPIGRPFLDYVLSALADAGYGEACLVVGPEHGIVRDYYTKECPPTRLSVDFAVQDEPRGTADAVAAAETFAGDDPFLVINSDNYYPVDALRRLRELDGPGLAGFEKSAMLAGNIPADRIAKFAVLETDADGNMTRIIEKPAPDVLAAMPEPVCVSMNCWRFGPSIFDGCRAIEPSPRGELELPDAVMHTMDKLGERYRVAIVEKPVLDMSSRGDIASVKERLAEVKVTL